MLFFFGYLFFVFSYSGLFVFTLILLLFSSFLIFDPCLFSNETEQERMWIWVNREENRNQIILYEIYFQFEKRIEYCTLRGSAKAPE